MELRSEQVIIRPWQRHDDRRADAWPPYHDPLEPLWNLPRQYNPLEDWYAGFDFGSARRTWAVENTDNYLIGRISLREIDDRNGKSRLGITFGAPYVGKGLGTEALALFLGYYFTDLHFSVMLLDVAAPNQRAVRSYERLGFVTVGDDWRQAGFLFDRNVLNRPAYAHLRHFFRPGSRFNSLEVQFFEMELSAERWQHHNRSAAPITPS